MNFFRIFSTYFVFFWDWPFFKNFKNPQKFLKKFLRILWIILNIFCTVKFFCQVDIFRIKKLQRSLSRFIVIVCSPWVVVDKKIHLTKNIENYSKYSLRIFSEFLTRVISLLHQTHTLPVIRFSSSQILLNKF